MLKAPGCPAKTKVDKEFTIQIPTQDNHIGWKLPEGYCHPDEVAMLNSFSTSVQGKLISVDYELRCYVKHDAWNEFGEGNCIKLPVRIMMPPQQYVSNVQV